MAEVDASIYGNLQQPNILERMGQMSGIQNSMNQNRLFEQEFRGRQAMGQAYQDSIDPATGKLDSNKFTKLISSNPDAAFMTGQAIEDAQTRESQQQQITAQKMENVVKHANLMGGYFQELIGDGTKPITQKDAIGMAGKIIADGLATPTDVAAEMGQVDFNNPDAARKWAASNLLRYKSMAGDAQAAMPQLTQVDTGGGIKMIDTNPVTNKDIVGTEIKKTLPPTTPVINNQGQRGYNVDGKFVPAEMVPGGEEAAGVTGASSGQRAVDLSTAAEAVPDNKAALSQMSGALKGFRAGPLAGKWEGLVAPLAQVLNVKSDQVASKEEFDKLAQRFAQRQFSILGGTGTDDKLEAAQKANPGSFLSELGNEKIIALLQGNEDAIAAKNQAWEEWQQKPDYKGPQSYPQFTTDFNKAYDPRVFQLQHMAPEDQRKTIRDMNETELTKFKKSYKTAIERGWVPPLGGATNAK